MDITERLREVPTMGHDAGCVIEAAKEIDRLRLLGDEPMRVIAVEAIREVTGCPDIGGNGKYLVDVLMEKVRDFVTPNAELTERRAEAADKTTGA